MVPEINYWAVLIATASSMVVGSIWYARKVFGTRWAKLANVDMDRPGASAVLPIVVTVVVSFITAWVLAGATAIAWHFYGGGFLWTAIATSIALWAGFTAARLITHDAFEGRPDLADGAEHRARARHRAHHGPDHRRLAACRDGLTPGPPSASSEAVRSGGSDG